MIKEKIAAIIHDNFSYIYCFNCGHYMGTEVNTACDWCHRKYMGWTVSDIHCMAVTEGIMKAIEEDKQEV